MLQNEIFVVFSNTVHEMQIVHSRIYHKSLTQMLFRVSFYAWKKVVSSTEERENVNIRLGSVIQFLICP